MSQKPVFNAEFKKGEKKPVVIKHDDGSETHLTAESAIFLSIFMKAKPKGLIT
ncbi:hypothetical protein [Herbiconiux daphne]|uniref:Uncharacterized protein n=1 Tax=Herbiconiux daphne TaxID=2970914 RepID=A0ABT2HBH3_9MICO|nr:hypothetical protein [Herbiconiux daphne]MCS5737243.1 hypothetical protein [Herbiconiux daphne]